MNLFSRLAKSPRLLIGISWGLTALVVAGLVGFAFWKITPQQVSAAPEPTPTPTEKGVSASLPTLTGLDVGSQEAIVRHIVLKTDISSSTNYNVVEYTVAPGDAIFSIAKKFNITPETLFWANSKTLQDNPENIRSSQALEVPPTDGVYYQWQQGDTLDLVASKYKANAEDILNWPGNNMDLTNPIISPGTFVMIPGGKDKPVDWIRPQVARGHSGTSSMAGATCDGPVGTGGFIWPADNHFLSGYDFSSSHLGIDIAAGLGAPVYASDSGVVVTAGWNSSGYGNVIMIDHGNGYSTVYGHLSQINVSLCSPVTQGQVIGLAGSTGNSTGAHLHFEVRLNGQYVDPWYVLP
jgi:LysM repeat protein